MNKVARDLSVRRMRTDLARVNFECLRFRYLSDIRNTITKEGGSSWWTCL